MDERVSKSERRVVSNDEDEEMRRQREERRSRQVDMQGVVLVHAVVERGGK